MKVNSFVMAMEGWCISRYPGSEGGSLIKEVSAFIRGIQEAFTVSPPRDNTRKPGANNPEEGPPESLNGGIVIWDSQFPEL